MLFLNIILLLLLFSICSSQNIQSMINNAISSGNNEVVLPSGTIRVYSPIVIYGAKNLRIKGSGNTKLIFQTTLTNNDHNIKIEKSNAITLQDIQIDMDPLPFTQGQVTRVDFKSFDVQIHDGYPRDNSMFGKESYIHVHDASSRRFKQEGDISYVDWTESISNGIRVFITGNTDYSNIKVGDLVSIGRPKFLCAISLYNTQNTALQNIVINAAQGCAVLENGGSGTIIDRVIIKKGEKPSGAREERLISINRDGFHLNGPKGGTIIKNCIVEFSGDDAINIRSSFGIVTNVVGNTIHFKPDYLNFAPGTYLNIYDPKTFILKDTVSVRQHDMGIGSAVVERTWNIKENSDLIVSPQHTQNFIIQDNNFTDIDARGIVATGSNIYIERNRIERTTMGGIWVGAELGYYNEGGFADTVYIRGNIVTYSSYALRGRRQSSTLLGAISVVNEFKEGQQLNYKKNRPNRNIIISDNKVQSASLASIFLNAVVNVSVCKNNLFFDNQLYNNGAGHEFGIIPRYSITIHDTSNIKIYQNWVQTGPYTINMRWVSDSEGVTDPANNPCA